MQKLPFKASWRNIWLLPRRILEIPKREKYFSRPAYCAIAWGRKAKILLQPLTGPQPVMMNRFLPRSLIRMPPWKGGMRFIGLQRKTMVWWKVTCTIRMKKELRFHLWEVGRYLFRRMRSKIKAFSAVGLSCQGAWLIALRMTKYPIFWRIYKH